MNAAIRAERPDDMRSRVVEVYTAYAESADPAHTVEDYLEYLELYGAYGLDESGSESDSEG